LGEQGDAEDDPQHNRQERRAPCRTMTSPNEL
jgi:hypothetical protein